MSDSSSLVNSDHKVFDSTLGCVDCGDGIAGGPDSTTARAPTFRAIHVSGCSVGAADGPGAGAPAGGAEEMTELLEVRPAFVLS